MLPSSNFIEGFLTPYLYKSTKNLTSPTAKKTAILHNTMTGLGYLAALGAIFSIVEGIRICISLQYLSKTTNLRSVQAGIIVGSSVRAVLATFTGPIILPFIDLTVAKFSD